MAKLTGNLMHFTWAPTGEGPTVETNGHQWELTSVTRQFNTTAENTLTWEEYTTGLSTGRLRARFFVDTTTPLIPIGAIGEAVLYTNTGTSTKYTVQARCDRMTYTGSSNTGGAPQIVEYSFQVTLNGATAGIVSA